MSAFQERMKKLANGLSPDAKNVVRQVLTAEHKRRFSENRADLPETFATLALKAAKHKESGQ